MCLESMLEEDGEIYIFADPNQNLFHTDMDKLKKMPVSKHQLTPKRIIILSPHRMERSSLAGLTKIKEWSLNKVGDPVQNGIRFDTIRSFKVLESDIVFLIGIKPESQVCTSTDVYVGGSGARFLLYTFHQNT